MTWEQIRALSSSGIFNHAWSVFFEMNQRIARQLEDANNSRRPHGPLSSGVGLTLFFVFSSAAALAWDVLMSIPTDARFLRHAVRREGRDGVGLTRLIRVMAPLNFSPKC